MRKAANGQGTLRQRSDGRWEARVNRDGKRISVYGDTEKEAATKLTAKVAAELAGIPEPKAPARLTVAQCLDQWLEALREEDTLKPSTWQNYATVVRAQLVPRIGQIRLVKLTFRDLEAMNAKLRQEKKSQATIKAMHATLHSAMRWAQRQDLIINDPTALVDTSSFGRRRKVHRGLTRSETRAVLKVLRQDDWWEGVFTTALFSGARFGELAALRWQDLDLESREDGRGILSVKHGLYRVSKANARRLGLESGVQIGSPKTETSIRHVLLALPAVDTLLNHRRRQKARYLLYGRAWSTEELVFQTLRFAPINQSKTNEAWHRIQTQAGISIEDQVRLHDTRRTAITMGVGAGDLRAVMSFAGHKNTDQSLAYTDPGTQEAIVRHMEQLMAEEVEEEAN